MITQYLPDILQSVVARVESSLNLGVVFDYGHYTEVVKNLGFKDESTTSKDKKYPLVWLVMDFEENMFPLPSVYAAVNVMIIIATPTDPVWTMPERAVNFKNNLYPVYQELIKQITIDVRFGMPSENMLKHTKIDRPYWGGSPDTNGNNSANLFNDFIDAIQIKNLNLKISQKIC